MRQKCKTFAATVPRDALIVAVLLTASSLSFGLGYLAGRDARPASAITIDTAFETGTERASTSKIGTPTGNVGVVASKNGTKYYFPSCAGAERISEANKVWFVSPDAAVRAGYAPAANCQGL